MFEITRDLRGIHIELFYVQKYYLACLSKLQILKDQSRIESTEPTETRSTFGFTSTLPNLESGHNIYTTLELIKPIGTYDTSLACCQNTFDHPMQDLLFRMNYYPENEIAHLLLPNNDLLVRIQLKKPRVN